MKKYLLLLLVIGACSPRYPAYVVKDVHPNYFIAVRGNGISKCIEKKPGDSVWQGKKIIIVHKSDSYATHSSNYGMPEFVYTAE